MITLKNISLKDDLDWDGLINQSSTATFFQTKEWLKLWTKHFGGDKNILGILDGDKLIGIAPMEVRENKINFLGLNPVLGKELVSDFGDIITITSCEKIVWKEVLEYIKNQKLNIELSLIREDSLSFEILKELGGRFEETDVAPYIDLPDSWDEYLGTLSRHDRHELRRKMRKVESEGVIFTDYQKDLNEIDEFFRLMIAGDEQKRNFLSSKMKAFFQDIFAVFYPKKMLKLCFLKLSGKNIASILLFSYKDEILLYNSGFDPQFSYLTPGLLLKAYAIKHAIEEKKKRFDFLRGGERYKYNLGGKERKLYKVTFTT